MFSALQFGLIPEVISDPNASDSDCDSVSFDDWLDDSVLLGEEHDDRKIARSGIANSPMVLRKEVDTSILSIVNYLR